MIRSRDMVQIQSSARPRHSTRSPASCGGSIPTLNLHGRHRMRLRRPSRPVAVRHSPQLRKGGNCGPAAGPGPLPSAPRAQECRMAQWLRWPLVVCHAHAKLVQGQGDVRAWSGRGGHVALHRRDDNVPCAARHEAGDAPFQVEDDEFEEEPARGTEDEGGLRRLPHQARVVELQQLGDGEGEARLLAPEPGGTHAQGGPRVEGVRRVLLEGGEDLGRQAQHGGPRVHVRVAHTAIHRRRERRAEDGPLGAVDEVKARHVNVEVARRVEAHRPDRLGCVVELVGGGRVAKEHLTRTGTHTAAPMDRHLLRGQVVAHYIAHGRRSKRGTTLLPRARSNGPRRPPGEILHIGVHAAAGDAKYACGDGRGQRHGSTHMVTREGQPRESPVARGSRRQPAWLAKRSLRGG
mmetsp:Transcript_526/g.1489  ORF Transcript_526/g.1489 Transcript_526/m.1489 type:complete len:406 (-) Transcript_526:26-1243(-)